MLRISTEVGSLNQNEIDRRLAALGFRLKFKPVSVSPMKGEWENPNSLEWRYRMVDLKRVIHKYVDRRYSVIPPPEEGEDTFAYIKRAFPEAGSVGDHVPSRWEADEAMPRHAGILLRSCFISYWVVFDDPTGETFLLEEEWGPGVGPA